MKLRTVIQRATIALAATCALAVRPALGQANVDFTATTPASWNSSNWSSGFPPESQFNEVAIIAGNRSAFVDDSPPTAGTTNIDAGSLEIRSGGTLTMAPGSLTTGDLTVGGAGAGTLTVRRGGALNAQKVFMGGATGNTITLGETGGSGTASLSVTGGALSKTTRIVGPNVNFTSTGILDFAGGVLTPVITGATHSTINVTGTAALGGTVQPQFSGYTPAIGNSWNLVTATQLTGNFALDASQAPALPRGTGFYVTNTATTATLRYSNKLILSVDRATGATKITNVVGGPLAFDAYTIVSPTGRLTGTWNSLQDQAVASWDEADNSNGSRLTEFKTSGATSVAVGASLNLGTPYAPPVPTTLGEQSGESLTFEYSLPGQGPVPGIVEFTGRHNNIVLTIDPATGGAALQNESPLFGATIDGYTITSATGKLLTGNASWHSLADQSLSTWDEADNSNAFRITEFNPRGTTALPGGGTVLNLGTPVSTAGGVLASDFSVRFSLSNGQTLQGLVVVGALPTAGGKQGDADGDFDVDGADFLIWQRTLGSNVAPGSGADWNNSGTITAADLTIWKASFASATAAGAGAAGAVPEPASCLLSLAMLSFLTSRVVRPKPGRATAIETGSVGAEA